MMWKLILLRFLEMYDPDAFVTTKECSEKIPFVEEFQAYKEPLFSSMK